MTRIATFGTAGLTLLAILGCGGELDAAFEDIASEVEKEAEQAAGDASAGKAGGNKAACMAYIEHYNSLDCMGGVKLDAGTTCPDALDLNPQDMSKLYDCQIENTKCKDGMPDVAGIANCQSM